MKRIHCVGPLTAAVVCLLAAVRPAAAEGPAPSFDSARERLDPGDTAPAVRSVRTELARWEAAESPDPGELAAGWRAAGDLFREAQLAAEAVPFLQRALDLAEAAHGPRSVETGEVLERINVCHVLLGNLDAALAVSRRVVDIYEERLPPGDGALAAAWQELGVRSYWLEDFAGAADATARALAAYRAAESPDPLAIVWCEADLAEMRRGLGDYEAAEEHLRQAVDHARRHLEPDTMHAVLMNNLGALYWDQDRLDEAESLYRESLEVSERFAEEDPMRLATAHSNLGVLLRTQQRWDDAQRHLASALTLARAALPERDPELLVFLKEPALLHSLTGRFDEALPYREEALALLERADGVQNVLRAEILHEVARDHEGRGDVARASEIFHECLALRREVFGSRHAIVGATWTDVARVEGRLHGYGAPSVGRALSDALSILAETTAAPEAEARALALRALREHSLGDAPAARRTMEQALARVEGLRGRRGANDEARLRFVAEHLDYNDRLVEWLVDAGEGRAALARAESMRARVLAEQLAASGVDLRRGIPADVLAPLEERERNARIRISEARQELQWTTGDVARTDAEKLETVPELERELDEALHDYETVRDEIKLHSPAWREIIRDEADAVSLARLRREALRADEALLVYRIGTRRSFAFVLPAGSTELVVAELTLSDADALRFGLEAGALSGRDLDELLFAGGGIADLHAVRGTARGVTGVRALDGPAGVPLSARLHTLWSTLVPGEIWSAVASAGSVVLVPDGPLHALPFECLRTANSAAAVYWLDEGPVIRYAHSLSTLLPEHESARRPADGRLLTVSDPAFAAEASGTPSRSGWNLVRLPGTARESEAIRRAFPPERVVSLQGSDATEQRVRREAGTCRYLHVATHGLLDRSRSELLAALALTPPAEATGAADDGFLHLFEIYEMSLSCDLAVLSACDTNAGRVVEGEGVFALSRGFHAAGARNVVASLWPLNDRSAAELMGHFFAGIVAQEAIGPSIDYALRLRDAKRTLRASEEWSDPHYWAPFIASGVR